MTGIDKAILKAGGTGSLAKKCGCSYENVRQWKNQGYVGVRSVVNVHTITEIPIHELNPITHPEWIFKSYCLATNTER